MATPQDQFVQTVVSRMNPAMTWPTISEPGLPNLVLSSFGTFMAGINMVLEYLPPDPEHLPSLPSASAFVAPFMASFNVPSSFPAFSHGPLTVPAKAGSVVYEAVLTGVKFVWCLVMLPFQVITDILSSVASLSLQVPSPSTIASMLQGLMDDVGLHPPSMSLAAFQQFATGLGQAAYDLLTSTLA